MAAKISHNGGRTLMAGYFGRFDLHAQVATM